MKKAIEDDFWDLIEALNTAFKIRQDCSLTESVKAARIIKKTCGNRKMLITDDDETVPVSARFLRDYWPSLIKSKKKEDNKGETVNPEIEEVSADQKPELKKTDEKEEPKVDKIPSTSKLNAIAISAGYVGWEEFCAVERRKRITENTYFDPKDYKVENMTEGDNIIIGWYPKYYIELEYCGDYLFKVLSCSYNLKQRYDISGKKKIKIYGFGLIYAMEVCREVSKGKSKEKTNVNGFPLYPDIFLKPSKDYKIEEENYSVCICS